MRDIVYGSVVLKEMFQKHLKEKAISKGRDALASLDVKSDLTNETLRDWDNLKADAQERQLIASLRMEVTKRSSYDDRATIMFMKLPTLIEKLATK